MNRRPFILMLLAVALGGGLRNSFAPAEDLAMGALAGAGDLNIEKYRADAVELWESEIAKLEARDKTETHPENSILFVGSSSIRMWNDIVADMAPYHAIQRGYGGAKWSDVAVFIDRLIARHKFRAVVFFVANDISGGNNDKSAEEVAGLFSYILGRVREHNAEAPIFYVAVTPTPARFGVWPEIKAANVAARAVCERAKSTYFIGTESVFLNAKGKPRPELFRADKLHQNREGYVRWTAVIKSHLDAVLSGAN